MPLETEVCVWLIPPLITVLELSPPLKNVTLTCPAKFSCAVDAPTRDVGESAELTELFSLTVVEAVSWTPAYLSHDVLVLSILPLIVVVPVVVTSIRPAALAGIASPSNIPEAATAPRTFVNFIVR